LLPNEALIWLPDKFWLILQGSQKGKVALISAAISFTGWFLEALCLYIVAIGVGANIGIGVCMLAFGVGVLAGALSLMPGGLGGTEVVMVTILCWAGCAPSEAIAIVLIFRAMTLWFGFLMGMVAFSLQKAGKV
jgi:uncharacterized protein (TIRG00374 family)